MNSGGVCKVRDGMRWDKAQVSDSANWAEGVVMVDGDGQDECRRQ